MKMPTVFDAFPNGIVSGVWRIGKHQRGTLVGEVFEDAGGLDVIVDDVNASSFEQKAGEPASLDADLLVYAKPEQLPTLKTSELVGSYMLYNSETREFYEIVNAGIGKNQETGEVEHVEFTLLQTEVADEYDR